MSSVARTPELSRWRVTIRCTVGNNVVRKRAGRAL